MTRITQLKWLRRNNPDALKPEFRDEPIERTEYLCPVCDEPMLVSLGQEILCHKRCRREYKRIVKYQKDHETFVANSEDFKTKEDSPSSYQAPQAPPHPQTSYSTKILVGKWWERCLRYAARALRRIYGKKSA